MNKHTMLLIATIGILLQGTILACAGSNMQDKMMHDSNMSDNKMQEDQMQEKAMKDQAMMNDSMAGPMSGALSGTEGHHATGKVTLATDMGKHYLVLSDIMVDKVPDGHVYLAKDGDRNLGVDLGVLRQFSGNVSFALPAGTNPEQYDSVIIYCKKFRVEIGRAYLGDKM